MSNKNKKLYRILNYTEHFLTLGFAITGCVSAFASLVDISTGIMSSTIGLNICEIITKKSILKKKKTKDDEIALLAKNMLDCRKGLSSRSLIDSCITHDDFLLVDSMLKRYDYMKEKMNNPKTSQVVKTFNILINSVILLFQV